MVNDHPGSAAEIGGSLPAANLEALQDLLEQVEAAPHGSLLLDVKLMDALCPDWPEVFPEDERFVTSSTDAALALVERVLPGAMWQVGVDPDDGSICARLITAPPPCTHAKANHDTPALALCAAILKALIAQAQDPGLAAGSHQPPAGRAPGTNQSPIQQTEPS